MCFCFSYYFRWKKRNAMDSRNSTTVTYFILVGLAEYPRAQIIFFCLLLVSYLVTMLGNSLILLLIHYDPQLHTPMYFFLSNLSFLDICFTLSIMPQVLVNCLVKIPIISLGECLAQMCVLLYLGVIECFLLAVMAYDRFVAISDPLHYAMKMRPQLCVQLAVLPWLISFLLSVVPILTMPLDFCGHYIINHFSCELLAILKLACNDLKFYELLMMATSFLTLPLPFTFTLASYMRILGAVLKMRSADGRRKAFSTCTSHLTVVVIFYGTAISMYMMPQDKVRRDVDKIISMLYFIVIPMLNPIIYSLRNKDVKGAFRKLIGGKNDS
ncbi:olfactory receptor 13H1-like [Phascolarctos cinereus]|uniref:Olfactory receptor n=1 Tax=Phascolarctos cinereus TaxID=38626 RepID=A0A6P5LLH6_PHACI|nr:olfactory receptor 13H1-like [Phascolarctos cinereus]